MIYSFPFLITVGARTLDNFNPALLDVPILIPDSSFHDNPSLEIALLITTWFWEYILYFPSGSFMTDGNVAHSILVPSSWFQFIPSEETAEYTWPLNPDVSGSGE